MGNIKFKYLLISHLVSEDLINELSRTESFDLFEGDKTIIFNN